MATRRPAPPVIPRVLTIAGSDSSGGAGVQGDLKTLAALGVYGMSAITAVTAQSTRGVHAVHVIPAPMVARQIDAAASDIGVDAVKTGMLATEAIVRTVAERIRAHALPNLVVDPVLVSTSGQPLLREGAVDSLVRLVFPLATVVTPNLHEASRLSGIPVRSVEQMRKAAATIRAMGPRYVVVTGGHLAGECVDLLYDGRRYAQLRAPRVPTRNTHGTGCAFASAVAAGLARGMDVPGAVEVAKRYVTRALAHALELGRGRGPVGHPPAPQPDPGGEP